MRVLATEAKPTARRDRVTLKLSDDQLLRLGRLMRSWEALSSEQKQAVTEELRQEDPALLDTVVEGLKLYREGALERLELPVSPRSIAELVRGCGWEAEGWQARLLRAMDGAGRFRKDGKITASEILTGLRNPEDPKFLTTSAIERLKRLVASPATGGGSTAEATIAELKLAWMKELADAADAAGDGNRVVSVAEIESYLASDPKGFEVLALQNLFTMLHQIAAQTGEPDPFRLGLGGLHLVRSSFVSQYDPQRLVSTVIAQAITADDLREKGKVERQGNFRGDQLLPKVMRALPEDYRLTGYDMGHLAASADGANAANVVASFSLLNMMPMTPALNRFAWRYLEAALRDVIVASGARAFVYTGSLFLDDKGRPLPPEKVKTIGKARKLAVPTHCFKTALFLLPGGRVGTMSFVLPNRHDLPRDAASCRELIQKSRVSIKDIEKMSGLPLFKGLLPAEIEARIKADRTAHLPLPEGETIAADELLWDGKRRPKTWDLGPVPYEVDMALERISIAIGHAKVARPATADADCFEPAAALPLVAFGT